MYCEPTYEGEYYVVATTKRQAQIVFDKAKRMVLADPLLRATTKVYRTCSRSPRPAPSSACCPGTPTPPRASTRPPA